MRIFSAKSFDEAGVRFDLVAVGETDSGLLKGKVKVCTSEPALPFEQLLACR